MKKFILIFLLFFKLINVNAWKVIENTEYGLNDSGKWRLKIDSEEEAEGDDAKMWEHINAFLAFFPENQKAETLYDLRKNCSFSRINRANLEKNNPKQRQEFFEALSKLIFLRLLEIQSYSLQNFPDALGNLQNLEVFELYINNMTIFPLAICRLTNLKKFTTGYNAFPELPKEFFNLTNLEILDLKDTRIETVPEEFGNLINLRILEFRKGPLERLPNSIGNLIKLKKAAFEETKLQTLPNSFGKLVNLEVLYLNGTYLKLLPKSFGNLQSLKEAWLSDTHLERLPNSFGNLQSLQKLTLGSRKNVMSLPRSILNLAPRNNGLLIEFRLKTFPNIIEGDDVSFDELRAVFGGHLYDSRNDKKYEEVQESPLDAVLMHYAQTSPRLNLEVFKTLKLAAVPVTNLTYAEVKALWEDVIQKVDLYNHGPNYFGAQMVEESFGMLFPEYKALAKLLEIEKRNDEQESVLHKLQAQQDAWMLENSPEDVLNMFGRTLHKIRSLWDALEDGEICAWIIHDSVQKQDLKNKIVFVLQRLQMMSDADVPPALAQFIKGIIYCPQGQKGALDTLTNTFLATGETSDAEDVDNIIKRLVAAEKETLAVYTFNPAGNSQSVHWLEHYKTELNETFGFSNFTPSKNTTYGDDPFSGYTGNAAEVYLKRITPSWLAKVLVRNMNYYFDPSTHANAIKLPELLVWLQRNKKIKVETLNETTEVYKGSEHYFDTQLIETEDDDENFIYNPVRLTEKGALRLLIDMGIVIEQ